MKVKIFFLFLLIVSGDAYATAPSTIQQWLNTNTLLSTEHNYVESTNILIEPTGEEGEDDGDDGGEAMAGVEATVDPHNNIVSWIVENLPIVSFNLGPLVIYQHQPAVIAQANTKAIRKEKSDGTFTNFKFSKTDGLSYKDSYILDNHSGPANMNEWYFPIPLTSAVNIDANGKQGSIHLVGHVKERRKDSSVLDVALSIILSITPLKEISIDRESTFEVNGNNGKVSEKIF